MKIGFGKFLVLALCLLLIGSSRPAFSKSPPEKNESPSKSPKNAAEGKTRVDVDIFIGNDRDTIQQYFRRNSGNLPPGLAKRGGDLPPGLQKQLQRNGHLPPGLDKKVTPFPVELEHRLPPLKPGLVRGVIEGRAVIFNEKTSVILDIFSIF